MENQSDNEPLTVSSKSKDQSAWSAGHQVLLLIIFIVSVPLTALLFSLGNGWSDLGGLVVCIGWFALMFQMAGGSGLKYVPNVVIAIAFFVALIAVAIFTYAAPAVSELTLDHQTDATITKLHITHLINAQRVITTNVYATLVSANDKPIQGQLLVSGDNYRVGDHVKVYYSPSGLLGPVRVQDTHVAFTSLVVSGIFFTFCLWPITGSIVATIRRYRAPAATAS